MNAAYAVIIGEDELARGTVQVRDLKNSTQREIARDAVVGELAAKRQPA
jgi:histidyl-tRNA synthetase